MTMKPGRSDVRGGVARVAGVVIAAAVATLAAGCNAVHGLGSDLQFWSDQIQTMVIVDDPMND